MSNLLPYSKNEELLNVLSHVLGVLFACFVIYDLLGKADSTANTITAIVYGSSILLLFTCSTLYHGSTSTVYRAIFKKCDHCAIYVLIAGTYTPYLAIALTGVWATTALIFIWSVAAIGVLYKLFVKTPNKRISLATYLLMGWFSLVLIYPLYLNLAVEALWWLFAGGVAYSLGTVFYSAKTRQYSHAVWHIFVLIGCFFHYLSISLYVF